MIGLWRVKLRVQMMEMCHVIDLCKKWVKDGWNCEYGFLGITSLYPSVSTSGLSEEC